MELTKTTSLKTAFWKFLLMLIMGLLLSVVIPFGALLLSVTLGGVTYANYSEQMTKKLVPIIASTPNLSEVNLPSACKYLRLDKHYQIIESTLEDEELEQALKFAISGETEENLNKQYILVTRDNEYVILQYYIGSQFTNDWMNEHLPSPEILLYIIIGTNCISISFLLTTRFSRNLRLQLAPLFNATEEVSKQNLDFEVGHSKIKEFEDLLLSFAEMKTNLRVSLEQQWKTEQVQKEQIAALAHDIKTPLTIIQGNTDLLSDTILDSEQKLYVNYILESSIQMQEYIKTMIDISRAAVGYQLNIEKVNTYDYIDGIRAKMKLLCLSNKIKLKLDLSSVPKLMQIDKMQMERAIMNVVNNALYYSKEGGTIYCDIWSEDNYLFISITDEGVGFTREALQHAQERFFMDDNSRSSRMHFGMGLYITSSIVKQHGGKIILENSLQTYGARVIIKIPYS